MTKQCFLRSTVLCGLLAMLGGVYGPGVVQAQAPEAARSEAGRLPLQYMDPEEYGAFKENWALAQDDRGLLYVANSSGVLIYNGAAWHLVEMPNRLIARSITQGPDGRIYVGGQADWGYLASDARGRVHVVSMLDAIPEARRDFLDVWDATATSDAVYFLTRNYLFRWAADTVHTWVAGPDEPFHSMNVVGDRLYVHRWGQGLDYVDGDTLRALETSLEDRLVNEILAGEAGYLLLVTGAAGLWRCRIETPRATCLPFPTEADEILRESPFYTGAKLPDGTLALGFDGNGLLLLAPDGRLIRHLREEDGLSNLEVMNTFVDRQGALWLALYDGLARLETASPWSVYGRTEGLPGTVSDLIRHQGRTYAATLFGVYALDASGIRSVFRKLPGGGASMACWDFAVLDGSLYAACNNEILRIESDRAATVWTDSEYVDAAFLTIVGARTKPKKVYVGTREGLAVLRMAADQFVLEHVEPIGRVVNNIVEVPRRDGERHTTLWLFTELDGAYRAEVPDDGSAWTVARVGADQGVPAGRGWLQWFDGALRLLTNQGLRRLTTDPEGVPRFVLDDTYGSYLADTTVHVWAMERDARNNVWIATEDELLVLQPQPGESYPAQAGALQRTNTFPEVVFLYPDAGGILWGGYRRGIVRYDASTAQVLDEPPVRALIQRVTTLPGDSLLFEGYGDVDARPTLAYAENGVHVAYAAPFFARPEATVYRVRLDGFEDAWSKWITEPEKDFTNLPEGAYIFRVQAQSGAGQLSEEATFSFVIVPPWHRTRWAYLLWMVLTALGIGILVVGYNRYHTWRLQARTGELEVLVARRTEEIRHANVALSQTNEDLMRANNALELRTAELQQALEENEEILGITAHDLKNPLIGITGLAGLIMEEAAGGPEAAQQSIDKFAPMLKDAAERMMFIIKEMLDKHRQGEHVSLQIERDDLNDLVAAVLRWNARQAEAKNITLHFSPQGTVPVEVDISAIQRVIDNLVSNAVKYSPGGTSVYVDLHPGKETIRLAVRDEGPGLTEADKAKVFGKLARLSAKPTGGEQATGLGLYIVKLLVEAHGGHLGVESTQGEGATFWFEIPRTPPQQTGRQRPVALPKTSLLP